MEYLFVLAGAFAALFFFILVFNKGKRTEHWILSVLFFLIMISCYYVFLLYKNDGNYYQPVFSEINYAIPMLFGLFLWFYARSLIHKDFSLKRLDYLHFIPFILFLAYLIIPLIMNEKSESREHLGYPLIKLIINPIYIFLTLGALKEHRKKLFEQYSHIDQMHYYWLRWIAYGGLLLWIVACIGNILNYVNDYDTTILGDYFLIGFLAILLFILAYVGFNKTQIFQSAGKVFAPLQDLELETNSNETQVQNYETEFKQLQEVMRTDKPYLDSKLSLHKLSSISKIPSNKLSFIINQKAEKNFYEFINGYRVEKVKERLKNDDLSLYSILGIAEECGFNSKASFNRIFKKNVGMTPTEFVKKNTL